MEQKKKSGKKITSKATSGKKMENKIGLIHKKHCFMQRKISANVI